MSPAMSKLHVLTPSTLLLFSRGYTAGTPRTIYILHLRSRVYISTSVFYVVDLGQLRNMTDELKRLSFTYHLYYSFNLIINQSLIYLQDGQQCEQQTMTISTMIYDSRLVPLPWIFLLTGQFTLTKFHHIGWKPTSYIFILIGSETSNLLT